MHALLLCCRDASINPFRTPADEDIFKHREEDRLAKTQARLAALQQSVAMKTTFASRMQATTTEDAKELIKQFRPPRTTKVSTTLASASAAPERRKEKENMSDFIAKKREIFLLQVVVYWWWCEWVGGRVCMRVCEGHV